MNQVLNEFRPDVGIAMHRQISDYLRESVRGGKIKPGSRLPSLRELASLWGTNNFTVNEALNTLAKEGILTRRPKLGSFVNETSGNLDSVGIFLADRVDMDGGIFMSSLIERLHSLLTSHGAQSMTFSESRKLKEQTCPPPELEKAIRDGKVRFLLVPQVNYMAIKWLERLPIPISVLADVKKPFTVGLSFDVREVAKRFKELGCKRVGAVSNIALGPILDGSPSFMELFKQALQSEGIEFRKELFGVPEQLCQFELAKHGYERMKGMISLPERPDGMLLCPDTVAAGCVNAIMEAGVKAPEEMKIVIHRNKEFPLYAPFECDWLENSVLDFAEALVSQLECAANGIELRHKEINRTLIRKLVAT